jgi:alpha-1,3-rhamnosyl/mannosyltransferase
MKIITNVTPLLTPLTGIGHYTRELLKALIHADQVEHIKGMGPLSWYDDETLKLLLDNQESKASTQESQPRRPSKKLISIARKIPFARQIKRTLEHRTAKRISHNCREYIYWEPNYTLLPLENRAAVTIHDLSHIHFPQFHPQERVALLDKSLEISIEKSQRIIAVSEYTRQDIINNFGVSEDKIDIVAPAVSDAFRATHSAEKCQMVAKKYSLPTNFILSVATLEPRKNISGLLQAFGKLPKALRTRFPLVLVGARGWLNEENDKLLAPLLRNSEAIRLGYVAQEDLPVIYSLATCMAYVSFFEGYGMPIAEAMASGTAVITSNNSSMPEVASGCALMVEPNDIDSIMLSLQRMLEDNELRRTLSEKGKLQAAPYTWSLSSEHLLSALHKI